MQITVVELRLLLVAKITNFIISVKDVMLYTRKDKHVVWNYKQGGATKSVNDDDL